MQPFLIGCCALLVTFFKMDDRNASAGTDWDNFDSNGTFGTTMAETSKSYQ
jgi:hypothetical protein